MLSSTEQQELQKQFNPPSRPTFTKCEPVAPTPYYEKIIYDQSMLSEPPMPNYKKPGLFNKTKVLEENAKLQAEYERKMSLHNKAVNDYRKYQDEKQRFEQSFESYKREKEIYYKEFNEYQDSFEASGTCVRAR